MTLRPDLFDVQKHQIRHSQQRHDLLGMIRIKGNAGSIQTRMNSSGLSLRKQIRDKLLLQ